MCYNKSMKNLKILFWNLNGNDITDLIIEIMTSENIDVALFAEFNGVDYTKISVLNNEYNLIKSLNEDCRVIGLVRKHLNVYDVQGDNNHYIIFKLEGRNCQFNIVSVHLQSQMHKQKHARAETIIKMKNNIAVYEAENPNTIVIGDFNIDPFDELMSSYYYLHAVSFRELMETDFIEHYKEKYKKFYNPMLGLITENEKLYGSYYYTDIESIYWHFYDQCLLRKEALKYFDGVCVIKKIGDIELIKNKKPDNKISDHLPIILSLKEENKNGNL